MAFFLDSLSEDRTRFNVLNALPCSIINDAVADDSNSCSETTIFEANCKEDDVDVDLLSSVIIFPLPFLMDFNCSAVVFVVVVVADELLLLWLMIYY